MNSRCTLATMYGIGLSPKAPGTAGSLAAAIIAYGILLTPYGLFLLIYGVLAFTYVGTRSTNRYMRQQQTSHDPKEVVIDELVGQWLTYVLPPLYLMVTGQDRVLLENDTALACYAAVGFVLFRLFDILKPWPIRWADRKIKGGFGVMFDDILAAIPAGAILAYLTFATTLFN